MLAIFSQTGYTGQQANYLPFSYQNIDTTPPQIIQNAKQGILDAFVDKFKQINASNTKLQNMGQDQLETIFSEWNLSAGGSFAQEFSDGLAKELNNEILTSAGMKGEFAAYLDSDEYTDITERVAQWAGQADQILKMINERLNTYIRILLDMEDEVMLEKILEIQQKTGKPISDPRLAKYEGRTFSSSQQQQLSAKVVKNIDNLGKIIDSLAATAGGKAGSVKYETKNGNIFSPTKLLNVAGGAINVIGSEGIHEPLTAWQANHIKSVRDNQILSPIEQLFGSSGGRLIGKTNNASNLGQGKMSGKQEKNDIDIMWTNDVFSINFPVSDKLKQSNNGRKNNANMGIAGRKLTPQNISLGELLAMTLIGTPAWFEQHLGVVIYSHAGNYTTYADHVPGLFMHAYVQWENFKEAAKYIALFRALVGTGVGQDFAALTIINERPISIYHILKQADNSKLINWNSWKGNIKSIPDFFSLRSQVSGKYNGKDWPEKDTRINQQAAEIKKIYAKKYSIEINLGAMANII